jgi:3',5'-cyclic AMP phosphodiesterase CpdA
VKFVHLTDTHLVPAPRALFGLDPRARLAAAIADINRHHTDAAMAVVTGDLTHWGEPGAYADLRAALAELAVPYRLVLGNHDERTEFLKAFPQAAVDPAGFVQWAEPTEAGLFVFLDTLIPGTHAGALCPERLDWLAATLEGARGTPVYVFLHHAPLDLGIPGLDAIRLQNSDALLARLVDHGDVRHVFFGHVHRPVSGSWQGIPFSTLPATNHQTMLTFDRSDVPGSHEPPAYAVCLLNGSDVVVHTHSYLDRTPRFPMTAETENLAEPAALPPLDETLPA